MTMRDRGRPVRSQARRPTSAARVAGLALILLAAVAIGFGGTLLLTASPATTPSPAATMAAVSESPTGASETAAETGTPEPTASPTETPEPTATATPTASPTATPTPSATPKPSPTKTPVPTKPPLPRSVYVTSAPDAGRRIALTFDLGGRVGDAKRIVDYLTAHDVHATVFSTGNQAKAAASDPTIAATFQVVCSNPNIALGNHTMTHADFAASEPAKMTAELTGAEAALRAVCPTKSPRPFFRAPNGSLGGWQTPKFFQILDTVGAAGYSRTVGWTIDTLDWGAPGTVYYRSVEDIVTNVKSHASNGGIVLMHLGGYETYEAIQHLIPWFENQGYELVNLHELLGV